jgi:hypothetical protein
MCWGFWLPSYDYAGKTFSVKALHCDGNPGGNWYAEPETSVNVLNNNKEVHIFGTFIYRRYIRFSVFGEPFLNLICSMYTQIPQGKDFRMRVVHEHRALEKRGECDIGLGRRLEYLQVIELAEYSRCIKSQLKMQRLYHWAAKARIVQLNVKMPTLKEVAREGSETNELFKFCNNIIVVHKAGAFGGKLALWDFLKDVVNNFTRKNKVFNLLQILNHSYK